MKYLILFLCFPFVLFSQHSSKLDELSSAYAKKSFPILKELLSIPNDAFYPDDIEKNVVWCESEFDKRGFTNTRINTKTAPLLLAERRHKNAKKTVLVKKQFRKNLKKTSLQH